MDWCIPVEVFLDQPVFKNISNQTVQAKIYLIVKLHLLLLPREEDFVFRNGLLFGKGSNF